MNICDWYFACLTGSSDPGQWDPTDEFACRDLVNGGTYTTDEEAWLECVSSAMPFSGAMNLTEEEIAATSECVDVEACGEGPF